MAEPAWQNEYGFLQALRFVPAADIAWQDIAAPAEDACRARVLNAVLRNRLRDPLAALAALNTAQDLALTDVRLTLDILIEKARVYAWLGNLPEVQDCLVEVLARAEGSGLVGYRFLAFCRLAEAYAEVERWQVAQRYVILAQATAVDFHDSVYWLQLQDCAARCLLALGGDASGAIAEIKQRDADLSLYQQFRWRALAVEQALASKTAELPSLLDQLESHLAVQPGSFEAIVASVLRAKADVASSQSNKAIAPLQAARDWYADEDLAVRLVDVQITLAKALVGENQMDAAAAELESARQYCTQRNLLLQLERVETAFADLRLTLHPVVETNRMVAENAWKNRQAYVVLKRLGAGGQGEVYLAYDNARAKNVALKKLKVAPRNAVSQLAALEREVRGANAATVPGMARIIACGRESESTLYIVQDYVAGQSLRQLLEQGVLCLPYVKALAETLIVLHRCGVVHGDVKPENVMVTQDGSTMLVDFGLAHVVKDHAANLTGATARYAPPRHASRFRDFAWRDRYAVGLMILECLGAKLPAVRKAGLRDVIATPRSMQDLISGLQDTPMRNVARALIAPLGWGKLGQVVTTAQFTMASSSFTTCSQ
ncbi:MAG: serine/threonine protein kinase [Alphaproteobacteria bacterium]|nr:serine/threonine protein kinase [Alphaproteobacteria bacterium]